MSESAAPAATSLEGPKGLWKHPRTDPPDTWYGDNGLQRAFHKRHQSERADILRALSMGTLDFTAYDLPIGAVDPALALFQKISECGRHQHLYQDAVDGRIVWAPRTCKSRICPTCAAQRVRKLRGRVTAILEKCIDPRMLTLTIRATGHTLADDLTRLMDAFRRLRRTQAWKRHVKGGLYVVETTRNREADAWHPHLHVIIDGSFWAQREIAELWAQITGDSSIVDIRRIPNRAVLTNYITKYVSKANAPRDIPPEHLIEWATVTHGMRLIQPFGCLHGIKASQDPDKLKNPIVPLAPLGPLVWQAEHGEPVASRLLASLIVLRKKHRARPREGQKGPTVVSHNRLANDIAKWWDEYQVSAHLKAPPTAAPRASPMTNSVTQMDLFDHDPPPPNYW